MLSEVHSPLLPLHAHSMQVRLATEWDNDASGSNVCKYLSNGKVHLHDTAIREAPARTAPAVPRQHAART